MTTDVEALRDLYERTCKAMIRKDEPALRLCHAPEFVLVHMTGRRQRLDEYIRAILDGTLNYYRATTERFSVTQEGSEATVEGCSRVEAAVYGGGRSVWPLRLCFRAKRQADGPWRFTFCQASTY